MSEELKNLYIDNYIFSILNSEILNFNLDFIEIKKSIDKQELIKLNCTAEEFMYRVCHNVIAGYFDQKIIEENNENIKNLIEKIKNNNLNQDDFICKENDKLKIKKPIYYKNFIEVKINSSGIIRFEEIKNKIEEEKQKKKIWYKIKTLGEKIYDKKTFVGVGLTAILIIAIVVFNIKISSYIENIPLLSSIINVDALRQFEEVNASDSYYKAFNKSMAKIEDKFPFAKTDVKDIKVRNVSSNEKLFQITLNDGAKHYFYVFLKDQKYQINEIASPKEFIEENQTQRMNFNKNFLDKANYEIKNTPESIAGSIQFGQSETSQGIKDKVFKSEKNIQTPIGTIDQSEIIQENPVSSSIDINELK